MMDLSDAGLAKRAEESTPCSSPMICCQHGVLGDEELSFHHQTGCTIRVRFEQDIALRDAAREEQREKSVAVVQAEEEMDGEMPDSLWDCCVTRSGAAEVMRTAVRVAKRNIIAALRDDPLPGRP